MGVGISTRWNAGRHVDGSAMVDEVLAAGFSSIELSYDLSAALLPGIRERVRAGDVRVVSVHSFCPVPLGLGRGSPEVFSLTDADTRGQARAIEYLERSACLASEMEARFVVLHAGRVKMRPWTRKLIKLAEAGKNGSGRYARRFARLLEVRARRAPPALDRLCKSIDVLLPRLESEGVQLAFENAPDWECMPSESELVDLLGRYRSAWLAAWYDTGHGQVRENLGLIRQAVWLEKLGQHLAGFHVHDVFPPAHDHLSPGEGRVDFRLYSPWVTDGRPLILEPAPGTPLDNVRTGVDTLRRFWGDRV